LKLDKSLFTPYLLQTDPELQLMLHYLDLEEGMKVLELGCCGTELSQVLERCGYEVWGVDLQQYPYTLRNFIREDFLKAQLPLSYFDVAIDISALHHFGLGSYGDQFNLEADISASQKVRRSLKAGSSWFLVMDRFKAKFDPNIVNFVRQYNEENFKNRVCRGFTIEFMKFFDINLLEIPLDSPLLEIMCAKLRKESSYEDRMG